MTIDERELNGFPVADVGRPDWKAHSARPSTEHWVTSRACRIVRCVSLRALQNCARRSAAQSQKGPLTRAR